MTSNTSCACCNSNGPCNVPPIPPNMDLSNVKQMQELASKGLVYMQNVTKTKIINTGQVLVRFKNNHPEDIHHQDSLFALAMFMLIKSKDQLNTTDPGSFDKLMEYLIKTYEQRI